MSNRHLSRSLIMQILYQWDFRGQPTAGLPALVDSHVAEFGTGLEKKDILYLKDTVNGIIKTQDKLDSIIKNHAQNWPIDQITLVDRNILRIGIYELHYADDIPDKVAINEAIELAKSYSGPAAGKFVNGILGAYYEELKTKENRNTPEETSEEGEASPEEVSEN